VWGGGSGGWGAIGLGWRTRAKVHRILALRKGKPQNPVSFKPKLSDGHEGSPGRKAGSHSILTQDENQPKLAICLRHAELTPERRPQINRKKPLGPSLKGLPRKPATTPATVTAGKPLRNKNVIPSRNIIWQRNLADEPCIKSCLRNNKILIRNTLRRNLRDFG